MSFLTFRRHSKKGSSSSDPSDPSSMSTSPHSSQEEDDHVYLLNKENGTKDELDDEEMIMARINKENDDPFIFSHASSSSSSYSSFMSPNMSGLPQGQGQGQVQGGAKKKEVGDDAASSVSTNTTGYHPPSPPYSEKTNSLKMVMMDEKLGKPIHQIKPYPKTSSSFISTSPSKSSSSLLHGHKHQSSSSTQLESILVIVLSIAAYLTRFLYIGFSNKVIWDEAHFGKFASYYIKRTFYFDVHPPLGKFLIGFAGYLAGYNGTFEFESGSVYPPEMPYTSMRMFCALWGALLVPIAYLTAKQLKMSTFASFTVASMVVFDNAYTVISRFVLLDSMLLFFTGFAFFCWSKFHTYQVAAPFSRAWWQWLITLGLSLGLVSSVKWVGFFVVALVGLYTLESLWTMLGDLRLSRKAYLYHWISRVFGLIIVPVLVYLASFAIHFGVLTHSGPGDAQMSSMFQSNLIGNDLRNSPLELMYGSEVTLKNAGYGGGLLHSHVQAYPHGSHQQQVTCYHHKDANNKWIVLKPRTELGQVQPLKDLTEPVKNGDAIRLLHLSTGRNLHSHPMAGPITKTMYEVSGYGNDTIGDANDHWIVEVVSDVHRSLPITKIHTMATQFRLRHATTGCLLRSHSVNLPKWGFGQAEVVCDKRPHKDFDVNNAWNIEQHWNPSFPPASMAHFKTSFFKNVVDLNVAMWSSNNALTPDPEKEPDGLTSTPTQWPFLTTGLRMCSWGDTDAKFYMLGNPLVWWMSSGSIAVYVLAWAYFQVKAKIHASLPRSYPRFTFLGKYLMGAWFLHYLPFFLMGRVLYLHHYFPALYFSIFLCPFLIDILVPTKLRVWVFLLLNASVMYTFYIFSPITFGLTTPSKEFAQGKQWIENWNIG